MLGTRFTMTEPYVRERLEARGIELAPIGAAWVQEVDRIIYDELAAGRVVRDSQFRSYSAMETIARWPSVRRGEGTNIFPYQEEADVIFNTALTYELCILRRWAEPVLREITAESPAYSEARRILYLLSYFRDIPVEEVPRHSILREFIGGSSFSY